MSEPGKIRSLSINDSVNQMNRIRSTYGDKNGSLRNNPRRSQIERAYRNRVARQLLAQGEAGRTMYDLSRYQDGEVVNNLNGTWNENDFSASNTIARLRNMERMGNATAGRLLRTRVRNRR